MGDVDKGEVEFLKSGVTYSGEALSISRLGADIKVSRFKGQTHPIFLKPGRFDKQSAKRSAAAALAEVERQAECGRFSLIIMDEVLNALSLGLLTQKRLRQALR